MAAELLFFRPRKNLDPIFQFKTSRGNLDVDVDNDDIDDNEDDDNGDDDTDNAVNGKTSHEISVEFLNAGME